MFKQCQQHLCRRSLSPSLFSSSSSSNAASCTCACVDTYAHASRTKRNGREKREKETQPRTKQRVLVASLDDSDDFDSLRLFSLAVLSPSLVFSRYFRFPPIYTRSQFNDRFNLLRALCNDSSLTDAFSRRESRGEIIIIVQLFFARRVLSHCLRVPTCTSAIIHRRYTRAEHARSTHVYAQRTHNTRRGEAKYAYPYPRRTAGDSVRVQYVLSLPHG